MLQWHLLQVCTSLSCCACVSTSVRVIGSVHATRSNCIQSERERERERKRERERGEGKEGGKIDHSNVLGLCSLEENIYHVHKKRKKKRKTPFLFVLTLHGQKAGALVLFWGALFSPRRRAIATRGSSSSSSRGSGRGISPHIPPRARRKLQRPERTR